MIKKVVKKRPLNDPSAIKDDLEFWLSRPPEERIAAVEKLRRQRHGTLPPIQKVVSVGRLGDSSGEESTPR